MLIDAFGIIIYAEYCADCLLVSRRTCYRYTVSITVLHSAEKYLGAMRTCRKCAGAFEDAGLNEEAKELMDRVNEVMESMSGGENDN